LCGVIDIVGLFNVWTSHPLNLMSNN